MELCIIEGLHNHDVGHKINNIASEQTDNKTALDPAMLVVACTLYENAMNQYAIDAVQTHTPAKYIRRRPPNRQQQTAPLHNNNKIRSQSNGHHNPNVQLSVTTSKPDHIAELLEATKKMTKYFKKSYKHIKSSHDSTDSNHPTTNQYNATYADKHKCKPCNTNDQVNEIIDQTCTTKTTKSEPEDVESHDSDSQVSNIESSSDSE